MKSSDLIGKRYAMLTVAEDSGQRSEAVYYGVVDVTAAERSSRKGISLKSEASETVAACQSGNVRW